MALAIEEKVSYLHDARIYSINLNFSDSGIRCLAMHVHCHPDCGLAEWNDKKLTIEFWDSIVIHGEIFGIDASAEEVNMFDFKATERIADSIKRLTDAGIAPPAEVVSIVLHSGSQLDIACQEIRVSDWEYPKS